MRVSDRLLLATLFLTVVHALYSLYQLFNRLDPQVVLRMLFKPDPIRDTFNWHCICPEAYEFFHNIILIYAGAMCAFFLVGLFVGSGPRRSGVLLLISTSSPSFFSRALFSPLSSQHTQTYYSLAVYFFLAFALCGLLAGLAYLFSISTAQETEKRSEYECGFAPFDSATRLPFDVHFYLVGILFLIFDVEVALLFPWVLSLRTTGWFSFYLMLAFLAILSLGFLYEWKRGALIWPTRYSKKNFSPLAGLVAVAQSATVQELIEILTTWPAFLFVVIFVLHRLALVHSLVQRSKVIPRKDAMYVLWFIAAVIFFVSLYLSYYLSVALAVVFFTSSYLETNPFWPSRSYWWARILLFSFPSRFEKRPYRALQLFWGCVLAIFILIAVYGAYKIFYIGRPPVYKIPLGNELRVLGPELTLFHRGWNYIVYLFMELLRFLRTGLEFSATFVLVPPFAAFCYLFNTACLVIAPVNILALLLLFWMAAATAASYTYGGTSFIVGGVLYQKREGDPSITANMRYLWTESLFLLVSFTLAPLIYLVDWDLIAYLMNTFVLYAQLEAVDAFERLVVRVLALPAETFDLLHRTRLSIANAGAAVFALLVKIWADLKTLPPLMWRFKLAIAWVLFAVRGYFYTGYMHRQETDSLYGKVVYVTSTLLYTYVTPFINLFYFATKLYNRVLATAARYSTKYRRATTEDKPVQIATGDNTETGGAKGLSVLAAIIFVDRSGTPLGLDSDATMKSILVAQEHMWASINTVAEAEIFYEDMFYLVNMPLFVTACLFLRALQLTFRWINRAPIPTYASAELIRKYSWAPRKASLWSWLFSSPVKEAPAVEEDTYVCIDILDNLADCNAHLLKELSAVKAETYSLYGYMLLLCAACVTLFVVNCYLSRMCQHHYAQLNGILTDGALVVIPVPKEAKSRTSAKAIFLVGAVNGADQLVLAPMELTFTQLAGFPLLAEGLLFLLICVVITKLSAALGKEHNKKALAFASWNTLSVGLLAILTIYVYQFVFDSESANVLGGYFASSRTITLLKLMTLISALFVLDASEIFMRQHSRHLLEYPIMVALTTFFMLLLVSANHIMSTFLSLVGFSLGLYVLILYDANRRPSREAGLKYYYLSTLSSGFILYGILLIYTLTGTGNYDELFLLFNTKVHFQENLLLRTALLLILAGFFFKLSAFPGHLWAADVYEGSPAPVTAFFMLPVKIVVLGAFIRLFSVALAPLAASWLPLLTLAVIISILWGAFASVQEKKIRRFLAYASINQMGFLLMGLTTDSDEGYQAALLYIAVYAIMTGAFLTIFLSARRQDGSELLYVSDFRTLASRNWLVGWSLAVILFSMAGIPPLGGFFAKYLVLLHAFEKNLIAEVVVGLATSLISTYYYLRIIKILKFEQSDGAMPASPCLTTRRQNQLFIAEALLWSFILFAPAILGLTYTLAFTQGPSCLLF